MASMLLRQTPMVGQIGSFSGSQPTQCQLLNKSNNLVPATFCKCLPSGPRMATLSSPLLVSSMHNSGGKKSPECSNLVTLSLGEVQVRTYARADASLGSRVKSMNVLGGGRGGYSLMPLLFQRANGRRTRRPMIARGSQYDSVVPLDLTSREETLTEIATSATAYDNLLDSPSLREASSAAAVAAAIVEEKNSARDISRIEEKIERVIFDFRFLTLFGVAGSLLGAVLCFLKGCLFVSHSYSEYFRACLGGVHTGRVILYLVEAVDVYLMGTVMLIFGMGLYELFVSSLELPGNVCPPDARGTVCGSNLFGLFRLRERPKWLEIRSLDELKTKLGHVIVMILLVGMFEKSKKVVVQTAMDFLCFSASILLSSGALYLLALLHSNGNGNNNHLKRA